MECPGNRPILPPAAMTVGNGLLEAALRYASLGWRVFPLKPRQKTPLIKRWPERASVEAQKVREWWTETPDANIGIVTGPDSGLVVLDVDPAHGGARNLDQLVASYGSLPQTALQRTGGGGEHYLFRYPKTGVVKNSAGRIAPGIDIRGQGGFIVAPPSVHPSGSRYEWQTAPWQIQLPLPPTWLMERLNVVTALPARERITQGARNATLTRTAGSLRAQGLEAKDILGALRDVNSTQCDPPLPEEEVEAIGRSIGHKPKSVLFRYRDWIRSKDGPPDPTTRHILHAVTFYMDKEGKNAFPTIEQIANDTALNPTTVKKRLAEAAKKGWINRQSHKHAGQQWRNYVYLIPRDLAHADSHKSERWWL